MTSRPDRRHALALAATVGLSPAVLAACGDDDPAAEAPVGELDTGHTPDAPDPGPLANTDEIAVGGGKIFPEQQVVVTQPTEGNFKCFTAVCTHQGCIVGPCRRAASGASATAAPSRSRTGRRSTLRPPHLSDEIAIDVQGDQISIA